jgi:DNA (cytosine-5)-methyltransferase 1
MGKGPRGTEGVESNHVIAFGAQNSVRQGDSVSEHVTPTLDKSKTPAVAQASAVRRLTPTECERLQGFPDNYTQIPYRNKPAESCPDGPRYKAMGNSMAVPVMRWIGERINMVENLT